MTHDDHCELARACNECQQWVARIAPHCHCASRAFPLCVGCRDGRHLQHRNVNPNTGKRCVCDLCEEEAA